MHKSISLQELDALADQELRARLGFDDHTKPAFVSNETVCQMFHKARETGNRNRYLLLSEILSNRILKLSRSAVFQWRICPSLMGDVKDATFELSQYFWIRLLQPNNVSFSQRRFGLFFKLTVLMFLRRLLAKKRTDEVPASEESPDYEDDLDEQFSDTMQTADVLTPERIAVSAEEIVNATSALSQAELTCITMLRVEGRAVSEVAALMGVSTRTINTYKNTALKKLAKARKEQAK